MAYIPQTDWRTSKNNVAPDSHWSGPDDTFAQRDAIRSAIESDYSGAVVVRDATRTYNCHAFVHAQRHAWFNDITPFLRDDYYQYTPGTLQVGDAVVYVKDNVQTHSGTIIQITNNRPVKIRSKWGASSEVEHPPESVPADYGSIVYYLRRRSSVMLNDEIQGREERLQDLIVRLTRPEIVMRLQLASTTGAAKRVLDSLPEMPELELNAAIAGEMLADALKTLQGERAIPVVHALGRLRSVAALPQLVTLAAEADERGAGELLDFFVFDAVDAMTRPRDYRQALERKDLLLKAQALTAGTSPAKKAPGKKAAAKRMNTRK